MVSLALAYFATGLPPSTPEGHEGRLFPPEQSFLHLTAYASIGESLRVKNRRSHGKKRTRRGATQPTACSKDALPTGIVSVLGLLAWARRSRSRRRRSNSATAVAWSGWEGNPLMKASSTASVKLWQRLQGFIVLPFTKGGAVRTGRCFNELPNFLPKSHCRKNNHSGRESHQPEGNRLTKQSSFGQD